MKDGLKVTNRMLFFLLINESCARVILFWQCCCCDRVLTFNWISSSTHSMQVQLLYLGHLGALSVKTQYSYVITFITGPRHPYRDCQETASPRLSCFLFGVEQIWSPKHHTTIWGNLWIRLWVFPPCFPTIYWCFFPPIFPVFSTRLWSKTSPARQEAGGVPRATEILLEVASVTKLPSLLTNKAWKQWSNLRWF